MVGKYYGQLNIPIQLTEQMVDDESNTIKDGVDNSAIEEANSTCDLIVDHEHTPEIAVSNSPSQEKPKESKSSSSSAKTVSVRNTRKRKPNAVRTMRTRQQNRQDSESSSNKELGIKFI